MCPVKNAKRNLLAGSRVYLSGPMDFVASREEEKKNGWRNRISQFLNNYRVTVYDPWNKPTVAGLPHYGKEDEHSTDKRKEWTFKDSEEGDCIRANICAHFWSTLHVDLRMVDTSDFLIVYCPTNIYSVGTVHEIAMARLQNKPVLFVSPPVTFPAYDNLRNHLTSTGDKQALSLLQDLEIQAPLRSNPEATPSLWYMALLGGHYFFDGFGFAPYMKKFGWKRGELDEREARFIPQRPLLPYLEQANQKLPLKYDLKRNQYVENDDWLILASGRSGEK
ncbi:MAG: hypothetical protein QM730_20425 [Anaerolineales bacterium]